ncbi:MAG: hypothetical protein EON96_21890, partial [Caulobacteraceae bacterium]
GAVGAVVSGSGPTVAALGTEPKRLVGVSPA